MPSPKPTAGMKEDRVHLRVADQVKIEISRNAIVAKQTEDE